MGAQKRHGAKFKMRLIHTPGVKHRGFQKGELKPSYKNADTWL